LSSGDLARACDAILAQLSEATLLLGYSLGARLALASVQKLIALPGAASRARALRGVVLIAGNPGIERDDERTHRRELDRARAHHLVTAPHDFLEDWMTQPLFASLRASDAGETLLRRRTTRWPNDDPDVWRRWANVLHDFGPGSMPPYWNALAALPLPTLWLAGALDPRYVDIAQRAAQCSVHGSLQVIPAAGHSLLLERPAEVAISIATFLERLPHDTGAKPRPHDAMQRE
jgi:2-succinyl-6-hydroxy-2,4-cyclohexadiene-1-carboxylate synthase